MDFFAALLFLATMCMAAGSCVFWFSPSLIRYLGILFALVGLALFIFAFVNTYSSCCYYYEREILRKYGIKTQARLIGKIGESNVKMGDSLYRLQYSYQWQGKNYEGEEIIKDKAIFDSLQRGGSANLDTRLSDISASMGDGNRLPRSRSNEKTPS